jgi:predicted dienelactone hydrolase
VLVVGAALAGCSTSPTATGALGRARFEAPSSSVRSPTAPPVTADGTYIVGTAGLEALGPGAAPGVPGPTLPIAVWYPAIYTAAGPIPDRAQAPYPLLVFSQGFDLSVDAYTSLLEDWASAGFVVAAPTYPHTDPSDPDALDESDIVNHPADLRSVISALVDSARQPATALSGLIDVSEIGVIGHSDGGEVSLAVAENSCCRDPRVKAAVILSGAELSSFGGSYFAGNTVPLMVVQGSADTINPPACSVQIYDGAPSPKYYLDLLNATHEQPYLDPGPDQTTVARVVTDFFDAELANEHAATAAMMSAGNVAGVAQITDAPSAPPASGSCPGA